MNPIIEQNRYLTLATSDGRGDVWVAPLAYVFDRDNSLFYFYSDKNSKHCRHLAANPNAAIAIFDSQASSEMASGLQINAIVELVDDDCLANVMALYFEKAFPDDKERQKWERPIALFQGEATQRFYQVRPVEAFVNTQKDMIDCREIVNL